MKTIKMAILVLVAVLVPMSASAHGWHGGHGHWRSSIYVGGWWGPGPSFYYSPYTYTYPGPYVVPQTVIVERTVPTVVQPLQPQQQYWYYCESASGYYPYVPSCPEQWRMVPAMPSGVPNR